jgi:hypothetical protein
MKDKTVAILESRMPDHIASLVRKYGGTPFSAPALAEIPDTDPADIGELLRNRNSAPPDIFIFQTGVGTRALFAATDLLGDRKSTRLNSSHRSTRRCVQGLHPEFRPARAPKTAASILADQIGNVITNPTFKNGDGFVLHRRLLHHIDHTK